jgi:hypothetical protein
MISYSYTDKLHLNELILLSLIKNFRIANIPGSASSGQMLYEL